MASSCAPRLLACVAALALSSAALGCAPGEPAEGSSVDPSTEAWNPAPPRAGNLRVATFNIRNYPELPPDPEAEPRKPPTTHQLHSDDEGILTVLDKLAFDVLAVQEIVEPELFVDLLGRLSERSGRDYDAVFSTNEHSGNPQHVGLVVALDAAHIVDASEHPEVDVRGTLRSGLGVRVASVSDGGIDFGLMVLHLASGSSKNRALLRASQAEQVSALAATLQQAQGDDDFMVLGDLNTAREPEELEGLDVAFASAAELERQAVSSTCSSYWVKSASNPLLRPSLLDHVYTASLDERDHEIPLQVGAHCFVHGCERFESTDAASGGTFWGVSDHCPVYFEVQDEDRDAEIAPG